MLDCEVVVDCYWIGDLQIFDCVLYVVEVVFEGEFWCVYVDDYQFVVVVVFGLFVYIGQGMQVVDVGIGLEIDQYDFVVQ